jgi:hypothetical protein
MLQATRVEFDPTTGLGRAHYRIGFRGSRFDLSTATGELGLSEPGFNWRPHGDSNPGYRKMAVELRKSAAGRAHARPSTKG